MSNRISILSGPLPSLAEIRLIKRLLALCDPRAAAASSRGSAGQASKDTPS
jgi:hypothetical protein